VSNLGATWGAGVVNDRVCTMRWPTGKGVMWCRDLVITRVLEQATNNRGEDLRNIARLWWYESKRSVDAIGALDTTLPFTMLCAYTVPDTSADYSPAITSAIATQILLREQSQYRSM